MGWTVDCLYLRCLGKVKAAEAINKWACSIAIWNFFCISFSSCLTWLYIAFILKHKNVHNSTHISTIRSISRTFLVFAYYIRTIQMPKWEYRQFKVCEERNFNKLYFHQWNSFYYGPWNSSTFKIILTYNSC